MRLGCDDVRYGNATFSIGSRFRTPQNSGCKSMFSPIELYTCASCVCEWTHSASRFAPDSRLQALALLASG